MPRAFVGLALVGVLCLGSAAQAQTSGDPLHRVSFETADAPVTGHGPNASVSYVTDPANVKEGRTALRFTYAVRAGEHNALVSVVPPGAVASMKSVRFWIKTDTASTLGIVLQEEGGGRWISVFSSARNQWLQVEADPSDFVLLHGSDNPADPNGKLDMDKVAAVAIGDFAQMLVQTPNADLLRLLGITPGTRTLYLDDVAAYASSLPPSFVVTRPGAVRMDTFARSQPMWAALGTASVSVTTGAPFSGRGLKVDYTRDAGTVAALMRMVPKGSLAGARELALSLASRVATRLLVQLDEVGGGKYHAMLDVAPSADMRTVRVTIADMQRADDSQDANATLDLDQVHQVVIIDPTGLLGGGDATPNTLHIGSISTTGAAP
ncbi:MAG TPA: hypothetical protein VLH79_15870 [Chthonomonadales bacterium]|nr:hypothetical protein [Chthonomonadales bacterium]